MKGIWFNWEISLGAVLTIITMVVGFFIFYGRMVGRFTSIETKVDAIWEWWTRQMERRNNK